MFANLDPGEVLLIVLIVIALIAIPLSRVKMDGD